MSLQHDQALAVPTKLNRDKIDRATRRAGAISKNGPAIGWGYRFAVISGRPLMAKTY